MDTTKTAAIDNIEKTADEQGAMAHQDRDMANRFQHIPGWGMDYDPANNPTYPIKHLNGMDHDRLHYERAPQQPVDIEVFRSIERPTITRVFGTSTPPRGLSGAIRRFAYKYSEATLTHWMTLILADRVDVWQGLLDDFSKGTIPNIWKEKGWGSEWRTNKKGVVKKVAVTVVAAAVIIAILNRRKKAKLLR